MSGENYSEGELYYFDEWQFSLRNLVPHPGGHESIPVPGGPPMQGHKIPDRITAEVDDAAAFKIMFIAQNYDGQGLEIRFPNGSRIAVRPGGGQNNQVVFERIE